MSDGFLYESLRGVDWGVATADTIAAPPPPPPERGGHFRQWTDDIRQLVGVTPDAHRMVAGWPRLQPDGPGSLGPARPGPLRPRPRRPARARSAARPDAARPVTAALAGGRRRLARPRHRRTLRRLRRRAGPPFRRPGGTLDHLHRPGRSHPRGPCGRDVHTGPGHRPRGPGHGPPHPARQRTRDPGTSGPPARRGRIGTTVTLVGGYPATDDPYDRLALERLESWTNRLFLDPLLLGEHMVTEDDVSPVEATGCVHPGDLEIIATAAGHAGPVLAHPVPRHRPGEPAPRAADHQVPGALNEVNRLLVGLGFAIVPFDDVETTAYGWPIIPEGLADAVAGPPRPVRRPAARRCPSSTTEWATWTWSTRRGTVTTPGAGPCCAPGSPGWAASSHAGVDVCGYEYWSVLDNLEAKFRYTRLYAMAVPDHEPPPRPPMPSDWVHGGVFADAGRHRRGPCGRADAGADRRRAQRVPAP